MAAFGGGRFGLVLNDASSVQGVRAAATRIMGRMYGAVAGPEQSVGVAVGLTISLPPHRPPETLLAEADVAHMRAVKTGTGPGPPNWTTVAVYDPGLDDAKRAEPAA